MANLRRLLRVCSLGVLSAVLIRSAAAEKWTTVSGRTIDGKLGSVYGPLAVFTLKGNSSAVIPLNDFDDPHLDRIAKHLDAAPPSTKWSESKAALPKGLRDKLQLMVDGKSQDFRPGERREPEFFLAYFSAHWCGPCRRFTPELVQTYKELKSDPRFAERFELIFVSNDHNAAEQTEYIKSAKMPWPYIRYSQLGRTPAIEGWAGNGIPCLVVLTKEGVPLFHSYRGEEYLGPQDPLEKFKVLLEQTDAVHPLAAKMAHRLAVRRRILTATGDMPPKIHWVGLSRDMYPTHKTLSFEAVLVVDENGKVTEASPTSDIGPDIAKQFQRDAAEWLFLPGIKGGKPAAAKVKIPVRI
jgi:thiol-disulfide isomerase/thioredoxin